jgi:hypothetical protein
MMFRLNDLYDFRQYSPYNRAGEEELSYLYFRVEKTRAIEHFQISYEYLSSKHADLKKFHEFASRYRDYISGIDFKYIYLNISDDDFPDPRYSNYCFSLILLAVRGFYEPSECNAYPIQTKDNQEHAYLLPPGEGGIVTWAGALRRLCFGTVFFHPTLGIEDQKIIDAAGGDFFNLKIFDKDKPYTDNPLETCHPKKSQKYWENITNMLDSDNGLIYDEDCKPLYPDWNLFQDDD